MLFFTQILQQGGLLLVETMTLLIADSSEEFCNSLIDALQGNYRIQTCRTGKEALEILRSRLLEQAEQAQNDSIAADRRRQVGSGDRSGRIRTYNFPQNRVSDHRIELTLYRLDAVMNGELDLLIEPLLAHEQAEKLQNREYPEL